MTKKTETPKSTAPSKCDTVTISRERYEDLIKQQLQIDEIIIKREEYLSNFYCLSGKAGGSPGWIRDLAQIFYSVSATSAQTGGLL